MIHFYQSFFRFIMNRHFRSTMILSCLTGLLFFGFSNCGKVQFDKVDSPSSEATESPFGAGNNDFEANRTLIQQSCASTGSLVQKSVTVRFDNPGKTCDWEKNGNLSKKDGYFRARREQSTLFDLPPGAIICQMNLESQKSEMVYDDHFIITLNDYVIASSFDRFVPKLTSHQNNPIYNWENVVGNKWEHEFNQDQSPFCLGSNEGLAACEWPLTEQQGSFHLSYDPSVIQDLMALDVKRSEHKFEFVTVGDNDSTDCQHSPVEFTIDLIYSL